MTTVSAERVTWPMLERSWPDPLKNRDMLCFSHDWSGDPLSKTHLMRLLARENRILWVNSVGYRAPSLTGHDAKRLFSKVAAMAKPVRQVEKNIWVLNPIAVPFYGRFGVAVNRLAFRNHIRHVMRKLEFRSPVNWVFNPAAATVAGYLGEDTVIYYCVDEYTTFSGVDRSRLIQLEKALLERADLVIVSSDRLFQAKQAAARECVLVRHGVDYRHFRRALDETTIVPGDIAAIRHPIVGYFGLIAEDWVDVPLLAHIAERMPEVSVVLLGKVTMDVSPLRRYSNVHLLGRKAYSDLPAYCKAFDVGIVPFPISEVTLNANPLKAREYLAAGLPVVSTAVPEVAVLPDCRIATGHDSFVEQLRLALREPGFSPRRSEAMESETWEARLDEIRRAMFAMCARGRPGLRE